MKKEYIVELREEEADELMDEHWVGELVRCKDCKNGGLDSSGINGHWCSAHTEWHDGNWYCADGERRDDDGRQG